jgi:pimeloyl-ACP methyl ester carboxylesterase
MRYEKEDKQMKKDVYDKFYKKVPQDQIERLKRFRSTHEYKHITLNGTVWKYISGGQGKEALLLLTGGTGIGEAMEFVFAPLEAKYQMVSPTYPLVTTMEELADGIVRILETEGIDRFNILGQSFGGILAQVIVHKYPDKVNKLILSHTTTTSPPVDQAIKAESLKRIEKKEKVLSFLPFRIFSLIAKWKISKLIPADIEEKEFWDAYFHEMLSNMKKGVLASLSKCMIDFGQNYTFSRDDLANWPGKILILESDNDPFFHLSERKALKELYPKAQVHLFHGTGHLTVIVNQEEFLSIIRSFLQEK